VTDTIYDRVRRNYSLVLHLTKIALYTSGTFPPPPIRRDELFGRCLRNFYGAMTTAQMSIKTLPASCNLISRLNALVERSSKFVYFTRRLSNYPFIECPPGPARGCRQHTLHSLLFVGVHLNIYNIVLRICIHKQYFGVFVLPQ